MERVAASLGQTGEAKRGVLLALPALLVSRPVWGILPVTVLKPRAAVQPEDLQRAARGMQPSTLDWLRTARDLVSTQMPMPATVS
jgi:hypothetical protein